MHEYEILTKAAFVARKKSYNEHNSSGGIVRECRSWCKSSIDSKVYAMAAAATSGGASGGDEGCRGRRIGN